MPSLFAHLNEAPPDPILGTAIAFKADTDPKKVNLGVGAYRDEQAKPYVFPVVRKVDMEISQDPAMDKEYQPIDGPADLKKPTQLLQFGDCASVKENRIASCQALSGTGSLRVAAEFVSTFMPTVKKVYVSKPTWGNHLAIFKKAGLEVVEYPYWDQDSRSLNKKGMFDSIKAAPKGSIILLHSVAHNPTGVDPTKEDWKELVAVMKEKELIPMLDNAYQGYASGDLDEDGYAVRLFEKEGFEMFVCQSFAKNMGLYGERMGMLHVVCSDSERAKCVLSQLKLVVRPMYSSPPCHGARIVIKILTNPALLDQWKQELKDVSLRILKVRKLLKDGLEAQKTPGEWKHITDQIGMFSFTGLTVSQSERMISKWHIYMLKSGRISLAGLNEANMKYMVEAVDDCVRNG
eukprot:Filipodium_phascolosomae@DN8235_c0_g1_i1.p1